jgi:hypothetical protein
MQPHVPADAKRDEQGLRVTAIAMMNHEPPNRSTAAASEPVTLKNQLAQTAEPSLRMIAAVIAKPATTANL